MISTWWSISNYYNIAFRHKGDSRGTYVHFVRYSATSPYPPMAEYGEYVEISEREALELDADVLYDSFQNYEEYKQFLSALPEPNHTHKRSK